MKNLLVVNGSGNIKNIVSYFLIMSLTVGLVIQAYLDVTAINPVIVAVGFFVSTILKLASRQYEQAYSRGLIAGWYFYLFLNPHIPIEIQSIIGRRMLFQLAVLEITSFLLRKIIDKKYKTALGELTDAP